jgi:hypothetical protein
MTPAPTDSQRGLFTLLHGDEQAIASGGARSTTA